MVQRQNHSIEKKNNNNKPNQKVEVKQWKTEDKKPPFSPVKLKLVLKINKEIQVFTFAFEFHQSKCA